MGGEAKTRPLRHAGRAGTEINSELRIADCGMKNTSHPASESALRTPHSALAFVALGSNLGDSRRIILDAMVRLQNFSDRPILKSSLWQTTPVNCPPNSPMFVNAVVGFAPQKNETPESLLLKLRALEKEFGRPPKKVLNEPRSLDLDLIAFGTEMRTFTGIDFAASARAFAPVCASAVERNRAGFDATGTIQNRFPIAGWAA